MQTVPLIRSSIVAEIARDVAARGLGVDRLLERAHIPLSVREDPSGFLPGRCAWQFCDEIAHTQGQPDFLFNTTQRGDWTRTNWVPPMALSPTLGDALRRMSVSWVREIPMVQMGLAESGPLVWFWRYRVPDVRGWDGNEPAEQVTLSHVLQVVRAAAGEGWNPPRLMLESSSCGWAAACPRLAGIPKVYSQRLLAIALPTPLLALPISIRPATTACRRGEPAGSDFHTSLQQAIDGLTSSDVPSQHVVAEILGTSERSLRRRLMQDGRTWRSIVSDVKFRRATLRLAQRQLSIREIAEELGFSYPAHFTRFFRARTGVAPSRWNDHLEQGRALVRP